MLILASDKPNAILLANIGGYKKSHTTMQKDSPSSHVKQAEKAKKRIGQIYAVSK